MSILSFSPFGRGSVSNVTTHIDTIYNTLRGAELDWRNLHPNAGIHESFVDWNTDANGHLHNDNTLARGCLTNRHFNRTSGVTNAQVLYTSAPKTLTLFGAKEFIFGSLGDDDPIVVDFISTSEAKTSFLPGTVPIVLAMTRRVNAQIIDMDYQFYIRVTDVGSENFSINGAFLIDSTAGSDYGFKAEPTPPATKKEISGEIFYIAIGVAPGYLPWPEG